MALAIIVTLGAPPVVAAAEAEPDARAILLKMANCLAKAPAFSVTVSGGPQKLDSVLSSGAGLSAGRSRDEKETHSP